MHLKTKISGSNTINDWIILRNELDINPGDNQLWIKAYEDFLYKRIDTRYLKPIQAIKNNIKTYEGENFAIVTILCSLIEFLEATITGVTYKYKKPDVNNFEYNDSKNKFINFLENRFPFNKKFDHNLAKIFYENVRCGMLHEAQTEGNWLIRVDNKKDIIETRADGMIVFDVSKFQTSLEIFFKRYRDDLMKDDYLKVALRRKINAICRLPIDD